ncbi:MAG: hypothetical protein ACRC4M_01740 [Mycoplasma sp.]
MKTKLSGNVEEFLKTPKGYKKSWTRVGAFTLLSLIVFIVVICYSYINGPLSVPPPEETPDEEPEMFLRAIKSISSIMQEPKNAVFINAATWISITGLSLMATPLVYLLAVWIVGVNQPSRTPYFHIFLWVLVFIISILALIAMIFLIRSSIHNISNLPPASSGDDEETLRHGLSFVNKLAFCFN